MLYTALAPLYDRIMTHVRYDLWHSLIDTITDRYFDHRPTILEIGGGTGMLATLLRSSGYTYYGSDLSFAMCKEARRRKAPFFCADARHLPLQGMVDLVIFLYDGINYLAALEDYSQLFLELYSHIKPGGYFLFDITTETNSETYFADIVDSDDFGYATYTRHSYYDKEHRIQNNDFTIYFRHTGYDDLYLKKKEHHRQHIFSVEEISKAVPEDLYIISEIWDNFTCNDYTSESERIHFLIRKRQP